uniref:Adhesion G-protein coupled receptor G6 n=1 Tax=Sinocyclocheilus anshuiensis TaxID=1608454 RepID=A0A671MSA4_9TELE
TSARICVYIAIMYVIAQSCQSSVSCNVVLTDSQGSLTSPCYPNDYPPSQACKWTIQAPTGFIVQITFLDFELEEAHGCIYDRIVVSTGTSDAKFCGLTPNGLTLNSSGNVMEISFNSDFSVQKKGFHISYKQVAVALRNQKVTMPKSSKNVVRVANSVSIPVLTAFTVCFEIARTAQKSTETIFTLSDADGTSILAFEKTDRGMELFIDGSYCSVNDLLTSSDITSSMTPICLTWTKSTGLVAVYFGGQYRAKTCAASQFYTLPSGGILQLAGKGSSSVSVDDQNLDGFMYNFRLWDYAMPYSELSALTCDVEGNVIDWDHRFWTIPGSYMQTDSTLSCSEYMVSVLLCGSWIIHVLRVKLFNVLSTSFKEGWVFSETCFCVCFTSENCQAEDFPFHYRWPESRPTVTQYVLIHIAHITLKSKPNLIILILNSPENAMEVAVQLADITNNELSKEEVTQVVFKVNELVNIAKINATLASTVVTIISNVMISSEAAQKESSETALKAVDKLLQKIEFDGPLLTITSKYLAVGVSALNISNFNGTTFSAFIATNTTDPQIDFESEAQNALAVVTLPPTLLQNLSNSHRVSRINFMFFSKTGLFQDRQSNGMSLNSYVVASSIGNFTIKNLQDPVKIEIAHLEYQRDPKRLCVFWDFNRTGGWNSEGCEVSPESNSNRTVCLCNHLTHFGILMDISGASALIDEKNNRVLTFITYIGCGISAIFSAATLLTYIAFEKLRRDYPSKILMNLSTSLLFLNMVFLLDGWLASYDIEGLCVTVAVFLHFFLLTSFTWMGLESIHMYIALVKVFNTYIRRYILKFCLVGWGVPASIVGIVLAVGKNSYGKNYYGKGENGQGTEFCWIHSPVVFYVTCVGYFSMIFLMNVAMFIVVMIQICGRNGKRSNRTLREEILRNLRSVVSLTFLLGMTWGFAFFAWGPVSLAFMYLFSIFNSLQGLFIFVFHCALKENVQNQWRRYLCCGKFRLADNSDWSKTATNNTKKVSSDNLGKSLSSSSFGSTTANWTSKAKATLNPFARHSNTGKHKSNDVECIDQSC